MRFTLRSKAVAAAVVTVASMLAVTGGTAFATTHPPPIVPAQPAAPHATAGRESATVTWTAPTNGGSPITSYTVTATPQGTTCTWTGGPLACTLTGIHNGTAHTFTVRAHNAVGTGPTSTPSNPVVPVAPPSKPNMVQATAGSGSALVSWWSATYAGGAIDTYVVTSSQGDKTCTAPMGQNPMSCTVTGLTNGTSYTFTVKAFNISGYGPPSTPSDPVTPILGGDPGKPGTPVASPVNGGAEVSWTEPTSGGATIYEYYVTSTPVDNSSKHCVWEGGPLQCRVTGLSNGKTYGFIVQAVNPAGVGPFSNTSNLVVVAGPPTVPAPPSKPGTPSAEARVAAADVTWTAPTFTGGSPITKYVVTPLYLGLPAPTAQPCTWTDSSGPLVCRFDLNSGVPYQFVVRAYNALGGGATSTVSNTVIPGGS